MTYINMKTKYGIETIDQFDTYKEAKLMLTEYKQAFGFDSHLYLSQRSTKEWKNK